MSVSYRLSHLVFVNSLVKSVGELGVRVQFRDSIMAIKVEQSLSEKIFNTKSETEITISSMQRTY